MATQQGHHCKDCGLNFDSIKSLDVHLHYHKENLLIKWGQPDEANNNSSSSSSKRVTTAAADSSEQGQSSSPQQNGGPMHMYQQQQAFPSYNAADQFYVQSQEKYILGSGQDFPSSSSADNLRPSTPNAVSSPSPSSTSGMYRYHPYQQQQQQHYVPDRNNGVTSSGPSPLSYQPPPTPVQCDKCGVVCHSSAMLLEHISTAHAMFSSQQIKTEDKPAAEILDLDSHKVHQVFQPEEKCEAETSKGANLHSVSAMLWGQGSNSPQVAEFQQPQMLHYQRFPMQHHVPNNMASSLPHNKNGGAQSQSSGGQTWKSNEARRPKTYNCSACNKWFTSSGHLKRHYNTTLHKNAVKQSGAPDPATQPISNHHHPGRAVLEMSQSPQQHSAAQISATEDSSRSDDANTVLQQQAMSPPNLMAGPPITMEAQTGGLQFFTPSNENSMLHNPSSSVRTSPLQEQSLHQQMQQQQQISSQHHYMLRQATHPLIHHPIPHPTPPSTLPLPEMYSPNGQPPHISTIQHQQMLPISINNHHIPTTGNCGSTEGDVSPLHEEQQLLYTMTASPQQDIQPLPSFAQIGHNPFSANVGFGRLAPSYMVTNLTENYMEPSSTVIDNVGGLLSNNQQQLLVTMKQNDLYNNNAFWENEFEDQSLLDESSNTLHSDSNTSESRSPAVTPECDVKCDAAQVKQEDCAPEEMPLKAANMNINNNTSGRKDSMVPLITDAPYKCIECDKVFNKACYLTQHNKSFHSGHKPYKCDRCGKRFISECLYTEHLGKHAGDKPHKCEACPKQFNHKTDLRRHMCLHTGEKPYACHICGKGFIRKDHMLKHCETHRRKTAHHNHNHLNNIPVVVTAVAQ